MMDILGKQWQYITELFTKEKVVMTQKPIRPKMSQNEKQRRRKQENND